MVCNALGGVAGGLLQRLLLLRLRLGPG
jgi:hypothetical protein